MVRYVSRKGSHLKGLINGRDFNSRLRFCLLHVAFML
jgi:hypothetical protein